MISAFSWQNSVSNMWTVNFLMFKLVLEKAEEPEIKLPTSAGSWKKQESSRKTSISPLLTMPNPLTVWIIANTLFQQHQKRLYTWTSPEGQHRNQIDYILCRQRWRSSIQSAKKRPGADCGSDHELLIVKFKLKLKKVGKTTRPFRNDRNQIL